MNTIHVRSFLALLAIAGCASASPASEPSPESLESMPLADSGSEDEQLQRLYREALAEGGELTVYAGGDKPTQQDRVKNAFLAQYPSIRINTIVDLSKIHDARIDNQIAEHHVVADVIQLQTFDDFPRWKREGALLAYKPVGWSKVYDAIKDRDGAYTGMWFHAFAMLTATSLGSGAPIEAADFLKPEFKDKLVFTYPNDDDAVLFYFKQLTDEYGLDFLKKLVAQNPKFVRGTQDTGDLVRNGTYAAAFGVGGALAFQPGHTAVFSLPKNSPWVTWAQTAAILKDAPHPAAAKLYMSWVLSRANQQNFIRTSMWSSRSDVAPPSGYESIWNYPNADPRALPTFMSDRTALDRYKALITLYIGAPQGSNPNGDLGLHPGAF
ncbi:ABC transporter substrate-binding protein [Pendulispora rubella]|uniref:ABC transporter substrate-binding protein n=1 Tax=Pendulispora rubella TaxID=2741070 RepID=A0ABZ2L1Y6_9BACT